MEALTYPDRVNEHHAYPGETATAAQIRALASEYRGASRDLLSRGRRGQPGTWAPARLMAMQAIELELNAFLLSKGMDSTRLRGLQHDLASRGDLAVAKGLRLRRKTLEHLHELNRRREYLVTRYGPESMSAWTQINRLLATLAEVSSKVAAAVEGQALDRDAAPAPCVRTGPMPVMTAS